MTLVSQSPGRAVNRQCWSQLTVQEGWDMDGDLDAYQAPMMALHVPNGKNELLLGKEQWLEWDTAHEAELTGTRRTSRFK